MWLWREKEMKVVIIWYARDAQILGLFHVILQAPRTLAGLCTPVVCTRCRQMYTAVT